MITESDIWSQEEDESIQIMGTYVLEDKDIDDENIEINIEQREEDLVQNRDLDLILSERASRFYDPKTIGLLLLS